MRTLSSFVTTPPSSSSSSSFSSMAPLQHTSSLQHSPWHSPVPYLFGGLAAMLGLIAFALLILACSYWKLSGNLDNREGENERDPENGDAKTKEVMKVQTVYEEKIVVIMAGDEKPRFLATPATSRNSSFGDNNNNNNNKTNSSKDDDEKLEKIGKPKQEESSHDHNQHQQEATTTQQSTENVRTEGNPEQI